MAEEVNMDDINQVWDRILHIKTTGRMTVYLISPGILMSRQIIRYLPVCVNAGI